MTKTMKKTFVPFKHGGNIANVIRPKLFHHAITLEKNMELLEVREFILKYQKKIISATLFSEYMKVTRFQERARKMTKELPIDLILLILDHSDGSSQNYLQTI